MKNFFFITGITVIHLCTVFIAKAQPQKTDSFIGDVAVTLPFFINQPTEGAVGTNGSFSDKTISNDIDIEKCTALQFKYALLLHRNVESISAVLYSFIDDWLQTRYRYGGTTHDGIDCSAFTSTLISKVYGVSLPRTAREQYAVSTKIAFEDLSEGDLIFFNIKGRASHVGIYLGNNYFVHSSLHSGVTISRLDDKYYKRKFMCGGRIYQ